MDKYEELKNIINTIKENFQNEIFNEQKRMYELQYSDNELERQFSRDRMKELTKAEKKTIQKIEEFYELATMYI